MSDYDLVVRGGTVVDGSGGEPFAADVAVTAGRIAGIGRDIGRGREEVDAGGCIVTPGFVDVHTHYDGQVTWESRLAPSSTHGVTTVVMGNCGVGFAPVRRDDHDMVVRLMEGVEDIPGIVMTTGVPWNWETFPEYLDALAALRTDIDFAAQLPHNPLRVYVMGERGAQPEAPTGDELAAMRALTSEAIRKGAIGVTTTRMSGHRFRNGELVPSIETNEEELMALAAGLADAGSGVFQMIGDAHATVDAQMGLMRRLAKRSGRPLSFTLAQMTFAPEQWKDFLRGLEAANDDGLAIRGQIIPRPTGILMGLELSLHPFAFSPSFQPIANLPLAEKVKAMRDPALRARLLAEEPTDPHAFFLSMVKSTEWLFRLGDPPNYNPRMEDSIACRARAQARGELDLIYDTLLEREGREILYRPAGNCLGERFESAGADMVPHPHTIIGLGDGGAHYGMVCDGPYTSYFLTYWAQHADPARRVPLPAAIRMLTADPADAVGLGDRGRLAPGMKADLNVIDFAALRLHAPFVQYDLPAGGRRLHQKADGYRATIVSGEVTYRDGIATGALPGRLVRGARAAAAR
ncbi:N-acyl-D-amino-acid deacylase family protein [Sphingomonas bacterium]|uniref:N-acyl-D-amino-acid deacylase family protein n=1 Tax=Sphingomonas bacterium TaxID=1895847 RepID=UPI0015771550|nr:amidohydrolase family protein [Sphingomonas bacterium]